MIAGLYRTVGRCSSTSIGPPGTHIANLAEPAGRYILIASLNVVASGTLLRPHLTDPLVHPGRLNNRRPLFHLQRQRLLDVDVLTCVHRIDAHPRVPVIRRRNHNSVKPRCLQQTAIVIKDFCAWRDRLRLLRACPPHIAYGSEGPVVLLERWLQLQRAGPASDQAYGKTAVCPGDPCV